MNVAKFLRTGFFYRTPPVHHTFPKFYAMIEFFGCLWVQNWHFSYFLCHYFFFYNSIRTSIPWLFRTCFHTKSFIKCNFWTHYNVGYSNSLIKSLMFRSNSRFKLTSPCNILCNCHSSFFFFLSFLWTDCRKIFRQRFMIRYLENVWPRSDSFFGRTKRYFHKNCSSSCSSRFLQHMTQPET